MTNDIIILFAALIVVGAALLAVIGFTKNATPKLDVQKYRSRWLIIEQQLNKDNQSSYLVAVFNADKLLDSALKDLKLSGGTMGERMKTQQTVWSNPNSVWQAHKLRNRLAHESEASVSYQETRRALADFKQALKDVGAI